MSKTLLRLPKVMEKTDLKRATIYLHMKQNIFPKQFKIGARAIVWLESDIDAWIDDKMKEVKK